MPRETVFIKVSGDCCMSPEFIDELRILCDDYFVVACVGGGTQINDEFEKKGFPVRPHGPMGRESKPFEERQLARDVLERNQAALQDLLQEQGISAVVTIPVLDIGSVLCHVNGDQMIRTAYLGFDRLIVVTTKERLAKKQEEFTGLSKVEFLPL